MQDNLLFTPVGTPLLVIASRDEDAALLVDALGQATDDTVEVTAERADGTGAGRVVFLAAGPGDQPPPELPATGS